MSTDLILAHQEVDALRQYWKERSLKPVVRDLDAFLENLIMYIVLYHRKPKALKEFMVGVLEEISLASVAPISPRIVAICKELKKGKIKYYVAIERLGLLRDEYEQL